MPDEIDRLATKADLSLLKSELKSDISLLKSEMKADISLLKSELKAEFATKTELREGLAGLDKKIDRVAVALVNTQADVRDLAAKMATKDDINRVLTAIDAFAKQSESQNNAVVLHGHVLTEVQVGLKDHEGRLKTLESARS